MDQLTQARFSADFPDDQAEGGGHIVEANGRAISLAIVEALRAQGVAASSPVSDVEHYGWVFEVREEGRTIWFMLVAMEDPCRLQSEDTTPFWRRGGGRTVHAEVLRKLESGLGGDPRFGPVTFHPRA